MARPVKNHQNEMIFDNTILVTPDGEVRKETVDQEFQSGIAALQKLNEKPKLELYVIKPEKRKVVNVGSRNDNAKDGITKKNLKTLRLKTPRTQCKNKIGIFSEGTISAVTIGENKKETADQEYQSRITLLEKMAETSEDKKPKIEPLGIKPEIDPKEEVVDKPSEKPHMSYAQLIAEVLMNTPNGMLPANEIYNDVSTRHPYYKIGEGIWQNSMRRILTKNESFIKVPMMASSASRGWYWKLEPGAESTIFKRRSRNVKTISQDNCTPSLNTSPNLSKGTTAGTSSSRVAGSGSGLTFQEVFLQFLRSQK